MLTSSRRRSGIEVFFLMPSELYVRKTGLVAEWTGDDRETSEENVSINRSGERKGGLATRVVDGKF